MEKHLAKLSPTVGSLFSILPTNLPFTVYKILFVDCLTKSLPNPRVAEWAGIVTPSLQIRKLRFQEGKCLTQGRRASERWCGPHTWSCHCPALTHGIEPGLRSLGPGLRLPSHVHLSARCPFMLQPLQVYHHSSNML